MSDRPHFEEDTLIDCVPMSSRDTKSFTRDTGNENSKAKITVVGEFTHDVIDELHNRGLEPVKITIGTLVTSISSDAIVNCPELTTIYISPTVETIYENAITNCPKLDLVKIPDVLIELICYCITNCPCVIDDGAGYKYVDNCVIAPNNPPDTLDLAGMRIIGNSVFNECSSIYRVHFGEELISINNGTFSDCSNLESINFSRCTSLIHIGSGAFNNCSNLNKIDLSNCISFQALNDHAFYECSKLLDVILPSTIEFLGEETLEECNNLRSLIFVGNKTIESIEEMAYYPWGIDDTTIIGISSESALTTCVLDDGTVEKYYTPHIDIDFIYTNGFHNGVEWMKYIDSIDIGDIVQSIDGPVFFDCSTLSYVTIPASVNYIDIDAFGSCIELVSVTFLGKTLQEVQEMENYSWGIEDTYIIHANS